MGERRRSGSGWIIAGLLLLLVAVVLLARSCSNDEPAQHHPKAASVAKRVRVLRAARIHRAQRTAASACPAHRVDGGYVTHEMGDCAPPAQKSAARKGALPRGATGATGPDLSNHNPTSNWTAIRRHGHLYGIVKISEGTGYTDPTAPGMVAAAKRANVIVGGYLFSHVCLVSAQAEGLKFAKLVRAYHLTGRWFLDTEYGGCSSQSATRSWIAEEYRTVENYLHSAGGDYTGGWWSDPHAGRLFPVLDAIAKFGKPVAWISGYPNAAPIAGRSCNDLHQFSDRAFNGANTGDMSRIECRISVADLRAGPSTPPATGHARALCRELKRIRAYIRKKGNGWAHHPKRWARARAIKRAFAKPRSVSGYPKKWVYVCHSDGSCVRAAA